MKGPFALLASVVIALSLAAGPATRPARTYTDKASGLSVEVAPTWHRAKASDRYTIAFTPPESAVTRNEPVAPILALIVKPGAANADAARMADATVKALKAHGTDSVEVTDLTVGGQPAKELVFERKVANRPLKVMNVIAPVGEKLLIASFACAPGTFDRFRADAEAAVESVTFKPN